MREWKSEEAMGKEFGSEHWIEFKEYGINLAQRVKKY